MGKTVKITCDGCGRDLTYTGNCVDYRLVLAPENKAIYPGAGAVTDVILSPPVKRPFYFCDLSCLDHWRSRENHKAALHHAALEKWIDERGTREGVNGATYTSFPSRPREQQKQLDAEFTAAALAAFPMKNQEGASEAQ